MWKTLAATVAIAVILAGGITAGVVRARSEGGEPSTPSADPPAQNQTIQAEPTPAPPSDANGPEDGWWQHMDGMREYMDAMHGEGTFDSMVDHMGGMMSEGFGGMMDDAVGGGYGDMMGDGVADMMDDAVDGGYGDMMGEGVGDMMDDAVGGGFGDMMGDGLGDMMDDAVGGGFGDMMDGIIGGGMMGGGLGGGMMGR